MTLAGRKTDEIGVGLAAVALIASKNTGIRISKLGASVDALRLSHGGRHPAIFRHAKAAASVLITALITSKMDSSRGANLDRGNVIN